MTSRHGRNVHVSFNNPEPLGVCDYSGMLYMLKDLVKQMEWMGDSLQWTGFYVGKDMLDVPNEQNRPPIAIGDPFPIIEPRPFQPTEVTFSNTTTLWSELPYATWTAWDGIFNGTIYPPISTVLEELYNFNWSNP